MSNLESLYRRVELLESVVGQNQDQKDPVPLYNKLSKIEDTLNTKLIAAGKTLEHKSNLFYHILFCFLYLFPFYNFYLKISLKNIELFKKI